MLRLDAVDDCVVFFFFLQLKAFGYPVVPTEQACGEVGHS